MSISRHSFGDRSSKTSSSWSPGARGGSGPRAVTSPPGRRYPPCPRCRPTGGPIAGRARRACPPSSSFPESSSSKPAGSRDWPTAIASRRGSLIGQLAGPMRSLLAIERTALNFLQRFSGIATLTARYVAAGPRHSRGDLRHPQDNAGLAFSREIRSPLRRRLNHRFGLYDAVLIKDNHLAWIKEAAGAGGP